MPELHSDTAFDFETLHAIELRARQMRAEALADLARTMVRGLRNLFSGHGARHAA